MVWPIWISIRYIYILLFIVNTRSLHSLQQYLLLKWIDQMQIGLYQQKPHISWNHVFYSSILRPLVFVVVLPFFVDGVLGQIGIGLPQPYQHSLQAYSNKPAMSRRIRGLSLFWRLLGSFFASPFVFVCSLTQRRTAFSLNRHHPCEATLRLLQIVCFFKHVLDGGVSR